MIPMECPFITNKRFSYLKNKISFTNNNSVYIFNLSDAVILHHRN